VAVRDWKVYAYPSNFVLDKQGKIRYAYRGALEWDSDNIVKEFEDLL
jgi:peroxiredoxin